ncbi:MAG: NUDIX hydrolase [Lachnospiraceae bacterium]|nr:NUDIX hydrolase [Lachnospiraceae bacterium]
MAAYFCEILKELLADVIGIIVTGAVVWCIALISLYLKRNEVFFNKAILPLKRVFRCENVDFDKVKIQVEKNQFKNIFQENEQKQLLAHSTGKKLFNGNMVRLTKIKNNTCYVQEIKYFDFLTTNLVFKPASSKLLSLKDVLWHMIFDEEFRERNKLENRLKSKVAWYGKLKTFDEVLNVDEFANAIAISIVLRDKEDKILIVRRGNKNAISSGTFAVSATGSLAIEDLKEENPFVYAGCREVREELNLEVELVIKDIIVVKQKYQPVVLLEGKVEKSFKELGATIRQAKDNKDENTRLYAVPHRKVRGVARKYKFTDTSTYQLVGNCNAISWFFMRKRDIRRYGI